jgi:hypothetical protein
MDAAMLTSQASPAAMRLVAGEAGHLLLLLLLATPAVSDLSVVFSPEMSEPQ